MAAAALLALPFCPGCAGGTEVNGLSCQECKGSGRAGGAVRRRWRGLKRPSLGPLADVAGWSVGTVLSLLPLVPGVGGAAMVSVAAGELAGHVFGHGLTPWAGLAVGGVFALALDRRIP